MGTSSFDLVLYGATGFTGRQAAHYLARHPQREQVRFAIAGRSAARLSQLAQEVEPDDVIVADGLDPDAVEAMVRRARVIATTAGPFARYGDELVRCCAAHGVHYADITGETPWVRSLIDRFHLQAAANRARIVPFCGYDSVPSDIGTLWIVGQLEERLGEACREVRAFHRGRGGINGGTLASLINLQRQGRTRELEDPLLLNPEDQRSPQERRKNRDPVLPYYDATIGAWAAPFFMGPINTRVVRRSCALLAESDGGYGPQFRYQEYWRCSRLLGLLESGSLATFQAVAGLFARAPVFASLLEPLVPAPGTGPSEEAMDNGFFVCDLVATGTGGGQIRGRMEGRGDPGNRITVKCLCESALALALDGNSLPDLPGGVLTPSTGIGEVLVERLRAVDIDFSLT